MTAPASRARRYSRWREALALLIALAGWLFDGAMLLSGASAGLAAFAGRVAPRRPLADALYVLLFRLLARLALLPLVYLSGHVLEHRFGLSTQSGRGWLADRAKAYGLGLAFELPIALVSYATIRRSPRRWWLILSALALPFTVLLAQLYPVLIAPLFNRFTPLDDPVLAERVKALADRAGVPVAGVIRMDMSRRTRAANAFFAGLGPTRRIALGDTLLERFTPDEVEVVVAHELAHQLHRDIWKGVALGAVATLGGAFALARLAPTLARRLGPRTGVGRIDDIASLPLLGVLLGLIGAATAPLASAFSRELVERPADRRALDLTGRPDAFESAMRKLAEQNLVDPTPPRLLHLLLHSHPSLAERIAMARAVAAANAAGPRPARSDG
jgi:STE24 endopeptidase